jgi:uncharacterized repeat protein (TIGR03803 family)
MRHVPRTARRPAGRARSTGQTRQRVARAYALVLAAALALISGAGTTAGAQTFKVLYRFGAYPDGNTPLAGLLMDAAGNLYGTTKYGGSHEGCPGKWQCGAVFKLDTNGVETVLYNFTGPDGSNPTSNLIMDAKGNLYGTTEFGGDTSNCVGTGSAGCGVVFKLSGTKETVLYRFTGGADGALPWPGVIMGAAGALYGTTNSGGATGGGVAFKLVGKRETVLHSFCSENNCKDGTYLTSGLIMDAKGDLYGIAADGGDVNCDYPYGCGVVFKLTGKKETVLYSFNGSPDGANPVAALFMDAGGDLYGTTYNGGDTNGGTVFEVEASGKERVLHRFHPYTRRRYGFSPSTAVVQDASGNLYGTTEGAGGIVYEITVDGKEKVLHTFCTGDCSDGASPSDLIMDANGNLYGTAYGGDINHNGTVFMITPGPSHPR